MSRRRRSAAAPEPDAVSRCGALDEVVLGVAGHDDRDVAGALADPRAPTAGTGAVALRRRAFVGPGPGDEELVGREEVVVLGVRDCGVEQLADLFGRAALAEPQDLAGVGDVEAADETEDLTDLGRGRRRSA